MKNPQTTLLCAAVLGAQLSLGTAFAAPMQTEPARRPPPLPTPAPNELNSALDTELAALIRRSGLTGQIPAAGAAPAVSEPLAELGMKLFFSKGLGGEQNVACASCHHPALAGADGLSLSVGVNAVESDVLGRGRTPQNGDFNIPRNAPSVFNSGLNPRALFWDGRIERVTQTTEDGVEIAGISTPDSGFGVIDEAAGESLVSALAGFPVTSREEMLGEALPDAENAQIRTHLAARIGDYGEAAGELATNDWLSEFRRAFNSQEGAETLISFDRIALALGVYQRSMVLVNTPWHRYVRGDKQAISDAQKRGAKLFYSQIDEGGAGCVNCHSGDRLTNDGFFNLAFPQLVMNESKVAGDSGRSNVDALATSRFAFRVPSLINVAATAPYSHAGVYRNLGEVVAHYVNPRRSVEAFFERGGACSLPQFASAERCGDFSLDALAASREALDLLDASPFRPARLDAEQRRDLVAFLGALTDPCIQDRECVNKWVPDPASADPDNLRLKGLDSRGNPL